MRQRPQNYWQKRSLERLTASEKNSIPYLRAIQRAYQQAAKATVKDIQDAYAAYYSKDNRAFDRMKLEEIVPQGDLERFYEQMKKAGLSTYLPDNFKGRITRAEMLNAQAWAEVKKAALAEERLSSESYQYTYKESYYRAAFDTQKGAETLTDFTALDEKAAEAVLSTKFYGKNYSERIWGNTDRLAGELKEILAAAVTTGQSVERTTREVMDRFNVGRNNAIRLVRTETNYFHNQAELASYRELGIDEFEFMATLDAKTSPMCQAMDGKHFKISKAIVGENAPPLHPYCRSTIIPYVGAEWRPMERAAIDPQTGESVTITNMSYGQWLSVIEKAPLLAKQEAEKGDGVVAVNIRKVDYLEGLRMRNIEHREVGYLDKQLSDDEIISRLSGADQTKGSCASLSLAYVGNEAGFDVLDFRGGKSADFFATHMRRLAEVDGIKAWVAKNTNDFKAVQQVLSNIESGKKYILATGQHAAVIRRLTSGRYQYLELQSTTRAGWQSLTTPELKRRFKCQTVHTSHGLKVEPTTTLIDCISLSKYSGFEEILGYINTALNKQRKSDTIGATGTL